MLINLQLAGLVKICVHDNTYLRRSSWKGVRTYLGNWTRGILGEFFPFCFTNLGFTGVFKLPVFWTDLSELREKAAKKQSTEK